MKTLKKSKLSKKWKIVIGCSAGVVIAGTVATTLAITLNNHGKNDKNAFLPDLKDAIKYGNDLANKLGNKTLYIENMDASRRRLGAVQDSTQSVGLFKGLTIQKLNAYCSDPVNGVIGQIDGFNSLNDLKYTSDEAKQNFINFFYAELSQEAHDVGIDILDQQQYEKNYLPQALNEYRSNLQKQAYSNKQIELMVAERKQALNTTYAQTASQLLSPIEFALRVQESNGSTAFEERIIDQYVRGMLKNQEDLSSDQIVEEQGNDNFSSLLLRTDNDSDILDLFIGDTPYSTGEQLRDEDLGKLFDYRYDPTFNLDIVNEDFSSTMPIETSPTTRSDTPQDIMNTKMSEIIQPLFDTEALGTYNTGNGAYPSAVYGEDEIFPGFKLIIEVDGIDFGSNAHELKLKIKPDIENVTTGVRASTFNDVHVRNSAESDIDYNIPIYDPELLRHTAQSIYYNNWKVAYNQNEMDIESGTANNEAPVCLTSTEANRPFLEVMDEVCGIVKANDTSDELDHNVYLPVGANGLTGLPDLASGANAFLATPDNMEGGIVGDPNPYFNDGNKQDSYLHGTQHIAFEINGEHTGINTDTNYNSLRGHWVIMDTIETQNNDPQSVEPAQENIKVADLPWYFINGDTSSTCEDIWIPYAMTQDSIDVINSGYEMIGMIKSYPAFANLVDELQGLLPNKEKLVKLSLADFSLNIILQAVGIATSILLLVLSVFSGGTTAFQAAMAIVTAVLAGVSCWLIWDYQVKPRKETVNQIERAIGLYKAVLPILENRQHDATSLQQTLDGGSQINTKVNAVKDFSNQFTTSDKDTFDTALMEWAAFIEENKDIFGGDAQSPDVTIEDVAALIAAYDSNAKYAWYALMITEVLTCAARVISTVSFVMCVAAQVVAAAAQVADKIRELTYAIFSWMDQIERVCSEIGFAAASVPSYARAAYAMPVIDTQANMTKVTADLIKRTYDCGLMPIAGMRDGASKWGVLVAGPQGSQSRMINLTSGIEKPAEEIANAQAEIQTLNASKTGTSKAVPILLAITIGMTVVWIAINEILKSFWD